MNGELKRFIPPKAARWKGRVHNALHVESSVVQYSPEIRFLTCYYRSGTTFLGKVSTENCDTIRFQHCPCLKIYGTPIAQFGNKTGICDITAPGIRGTRIVDGFYWLCGHKVYLFLPYNWSGLCTPIALTNHTFLLYASETSPNTNQHGRIRRSIEEYKYKAHDSVWGTDVPPEFKVHSSGNKVVWTLFPWVGVAKALLLADTLHF